MKITYTISGNNIKLTHFFYEKQGLVKGFQEIDDMLKLKNDPIPRMVILQNFLEKNRLWGKTYENFFITDIKRTEEGEEWFFEKKLVGSY
jgi:hypothetical protein